MTPFMLRIAELVGTDESQLGELDTLAPMPMTRISQRIATSTGADGTAYGRLVGDGFEAELPHELDGPDALPDLLVRLMTQSGLPHHPVHI